MKQAPKRYHSHEFDGVLYKFRLTIGSLRKLEESTGKSWQETMETLGDDPIQAFIDIVWAASLPFIPDFTKEDSASIYDALVDQGEDQAGINMFIMYIMQVSGLFPKDKDIEKYMEEVMAEANGEIENPKAEADLQE